MRIVDAPKQYAQYSAVCLENTDPKAEMPLDAKNTISLPLGATIPSTVISNSPDSPARDQERQHRVGERTASGLPLPPLSPLAVLAASLRERTPDSPSRAVVAGGGSTPTSDRGGSPAVPKLWEPGNTPRPAAAPPTTADDPA